MITLKVTETVLYYQIIIIAECYNNYYTVWVRERERERVIYSILL